jgi:hypothetical protein
VFVPKRVDLKWPGGSSVRCHSSAPDRLLGCLDLLWDGGLTSAVPILCLKCLIDALVYLRAARSLCWLF